MDKRLLISRPLSPAELTEVTRIQQNGGTIYITRAGYYEGGILVPELSPEEKKTINYQILEDILSFGDLQADNQNLIDLLKFGSSNIWPYHKFSIYFSVLNLFYEISRIQHLMDDKSPFVWYGDRSLTPLAAIFTWIDFRYNTTKKDRLNIPVLFSYTLVVFYRLFIRLISRKKLTAGYLIYFAEKQSTVLNLTDLRPGKGHHILEYLITASGSEFGLLTEVITPKLRGHSDYSFNTNLLTRTWSGKKKIFADSLLLPALANKSVRQEVAAVERDLRKAYEVLSSSQTKLSLKIAAAVLRSLHPTTRFYLFRYFAARRFFLKTPVKAVIASDENSPLPRSILDAAKSCGIKTVGIQHGTIHDLHPAYRYTPYDRDHNIMPDLTLVWGTFWEQFLIEKANYPSGSVAVTGQLRTDIIPRLIQRHQEFALSSKRVIFASQPQRDPNLRYQAAFDVFSAIARLENCRLVLRLHPREFADVDYYTQIAAEAGCTNYDIDISSDLYTLIASCDLLITCFSTVGAETIYFNKPLIVLDHLRQDIQGYVKAGVAFHATNRQELEQTIAAVLSGEKIIDQNKYDAFITDYAFRIDGNVAGRVIDAITSLK
ncbi:CDP-glycerol glycerophosphotransferase family protein [Gaoshiqia sp. Z1-71]|uniref:CDP-glycerol glycerophosphotransferase family protein n=1 Tax=Gaoshiqia hydrogeniformans TaxID=3290090 RepID=UPI003BF7A182